MLRKLLLYAGAVALFVTFLGQWMVWGILCACCDDVILDDALSSNLHNSICQVASKFKIFVGICNLLASRTTCPLPWFVLVVFCHWWRCLPLFCWFVAALTVACPDVDCLPWHDVQSHQFRFGGRWHDVFDYVCNVEYCPIVWGYGCDAGEKEVSNGSAASFGIA